MKGTKKRDRQHYVYVYMDPRKQVASEHLGFTFSHEVFYVGKGIGDRCKHHLRDAKNKDDNCHKLNKIRKILSEGLEPIIEVVKFFEDENEAYKVEEDLINSIGRAIEGEGPLTNIYYGGIGAKAGELNPMFGKTHTPEARQKISDAHSGRLSPLKGIPLSEKHREKVSKSRKGKCVGEENGMFGKQHSEETKRKIGEKAKLRVGELNGNFGRKHTPEEIERMVATKLIYTYYITCPDGTEVVCDNLRKFCRDYSTPEVRLVQTSFRSAILRGSSYKGYKVRIEPKVKEPKNDD